MFQYEFMTNAILAGLIISILCPVIGLFIVLRRNSMLGDTLSHSSFAGVAIGLVLGINPIFSSFIFTTLCAVIATAGAITANSDQSSPMKLSDGLKKATRIFT